MHPEEADFQKFVCAGEMDLGSCLFNLPYWLTAIATLLGLSKIWLSRGWGLNPRPTAYKAVALPLSYPGVFYSRSVYGRYSVYDIFGLLEFTSKPCGSARSRRLPKPQQQKRSKKITIRALEYWRASRTVRARVLTNRALLRRVRGIPNL